MAKQLKDMTNEELWQLFPIIITEHDQSWKDNYTKEKLILEHAVGINNIIRISHFGSTAVPDLLAKPTIDILLEVVNEIDKDKLIKDIESVGYGYTPQPNNPAPHMMFMKGYTPRGFEGQVVHIHVRYSGDWDELYFRDYLISHQKVADEYGKLKLQLMNQYKNDRDKYTLEKTAFIQNITKKARTEIGNRYGTKT